MQLIDSEKTLEGLRQQAAVIRKNLYQLTVHLAENDDWVYDDVAGQFENLATQFDKFSSNAKDLPSSIELQQVKADLSEAFRQFYMLRNSAFVHIKKASSPSIADDRTDRSLQESEESEEPEENPPQEASSDPQEPDEATSDLFLKEIPAAKLHKKAVRRPSASPPAQEELQRRLERIRLEEQRQAEAAATLERIRQENETLLAYRQRQFEAEHFERLLSHNDLSKVPAAEQTAVEQISERKEDYNTFSNSTLQQETAAGSSFDSPFLSKETSSRTFSTVSASEFSQGVPVGHPHSPTPDLSQWTDKQLLQEAKKWRETQLVQNPNADPERLPDPTKWTADRLRTEAQHWVIRQAAEQQEFSRHTHSGLPQQPQEGGTPPAFSQGVPVGHPHSPTPDLSQWTDRQLLQEAKKWRETQLVQNPNADPERLPDPTKWTADRLRTEAQHWVIRQAAEQQEFSRHTHSELPQQPQEGGTPSAFSQGVPVGHPQFIYTPKGQNPAEWSDEKLRSEAAKWFHEQQLNAPVTTGSISQPSEGVKSSVFSQGVPVGHPHSPTPDLSQWTDRQLLQEAKKWRETQLVQNPNADPERLPDPTKWTADRLRTEAQHWVIRQAAEQQEFSRHTHSGLPQQPQEGGTPSVFSQGVPVGHPHSPTPDLSQWTDKRLLQEAEKWRAQQLRLHPELNPEQLPDPKQWNPDRLRAEAVKWLKAQSLPDASHAGKNDPRVLSDDPSQWPIEKLRAAANQWWLEQNVQSDPNHPESKKFGPTKAQLAAEQPQTQHRYQLRGIGRRIAGITHMVYLRSVQEIINRTENDTLRAFSSGSYYLSTAAAAAGLFWSGKPTDKLLSSCQRVTGEELAKNMRRIFLQEKAFRQQIEALKAELALNKSVSDREAIAQKIKALKSKLEELSGTLNMAGAAHRLLHEQQLDQELFKKLTVNGKLVKKGPNLQELGRKFLRDQYADLRVQYGSLAGLSDRELLKQIEQMKATGAAIKDRARLLRNKRALSMAEKEELLSLEGRLKQLGRNIAKRKGLLQRRNDLLYQERRVDQISNAISKQNMRRRSLVSFMRSMALRPMYNEQTEGTARMIQIATDHRTQQILKSVGRVSVQASKTMARKFAPELSNRVRYAVDGRKKLIHQSIRKMNHAVRSSIYNACPSGIRQMGHTLQMKQAAVDRTVLGVKTMVANTKVAQWVTIRHAQIRELIRKTTMMFRSIIIKLMIGIMVLLFSVGLLTSLLNTMVNTALGGGVIMSPAEPMGSGKVNLSPYTSFLNDESKMFQKKITDISGNLESILKRNGTYNGVHLAGFTTTRNGPYNNDRELLAMMAIRFNQELDLEQHPEIETYLRYMHQKSHSVHSEAVGEKEFHSQADVEAGNCPYPKYRPKPPSSTSPTSPSVPETEPEMEAYCPGHIRVAIVINTVGMDDLFQLDDGGYTSDSHWPKEDPDLPEEEKWQGWTDDNIQRVKLLLTMPWGELYEGFTSGNSTVIGNIVSGADELVIWTALKNLTGGNEYGAAGLMGNLYAESGLKSTNLQDSYESMLGYDDQSYTDAVDSGRYSNFGNDSAGYGLAQWTFYLRKQELLDYAHSQGVSIGNLSMQLNFLANELSGTSTLAVLSGADSVRTASDEVLVNFEKPADQSQAVKNLRTSYGEYFYNKYVNGIASEGSLTQAQRNVIQVATNSEAYGIPAEKGMCQYWAASVYESAGLPVDHSSSALVSGQRYGVSTDFSFVPPGAAVYGYASNPFGHVGIYVGNGLVYHNIGGVAVDTLDDWIRKYNGFCWGWQAGTDLTTQP